MWRTHKRLIAVVPSRSRADAEPNATPMRGARLRAPDSFWVVRAAHVSTAPLCLSRQFAAGFHRNNTPKHTLRRRRHCAPTHHHHHHHHLHPNSQPRCNRRTLIHHTLVHSRSQSKRAPELLCVRACAIVSLVRALSRVALRRRRGRRCLVAILCSAVQSVSRCACGCVLQTTTTNK